jgi:hypothetical protein
LRCGYRRRQASLWQHILSKLLGNALLTEISTALVRVDSGAALPTSILQATGNPIATSGDVVRRRTALKATVLRLHAEKIYAPAIVRSNPLYERGQVPL